jgi:hypothetical protein
VPYSIRKSDSQYKVVNKAGRVFGTHRTKAKAERQVRALYHAMGGE